jgi:hypothetical protein
MCPKLPDAQTGE